MLQKQKNLDPSWIQAEVFALWPDVKMVAVAGPVNVYDMSPGVVYGIIYKRTTLF